jgi:hypothetical protein
LKDAVYARIGDTVIICVHRYVSGQGATGEFEVVGLAAVELIDAKLTGPVESRYIRAKIVSEVVGGVIVDPGGPPNVTISLGRLAR